MINLFVLYLFTRLKSLLNTEIVFTFVSNIVMIMTKIYDQKLSQIICRRLPEIKIGIKFYSSKDIAYLLHQGPSNFSEFLEKFGTARNWEPLPCVLPLWYLLCAFAFVFFKLWEFDQKLFTFAKRSKRKAYGSPLVKIAHRFTDTEILNQE